MRGRLGQLRNLVVLGVLIAGCSDDTVAPKPDSSVADLARTEMSTVDPALPDAPPAPAEASRFVTFTAGLAAGAVPYATERRPLIIDALKTLDADVICLQEVWSDDDATAVSDGLKAQYPFSFREKTEDTSTPQVRCADLAAVLALSTCRDTKCTPSGIGASACVTGPCKTEYDALTDACKLCLAGNTANPLPCAVSGAKDFVYDGRNGLLLLSKVELKNAKYTAHDAGLFTRGAITADVGSLQVQCTHLASDLGVVPYPTGGKYTSWATEHAGQIDALVKTASASSCNVLLGDLNTGAAEGSLVGELPDNFKAFGTAGYTESWTSSPCTWCKENPLTGSPDDRRLDHLMLKGCTKTATYSRILDAEVSLESGGKTVKTRLSDHYGVRAELK